MKKIFSLGLAADSIGSAVVQYDKNAQLGKFCNANVVNLFLKANYKGLFSTSNTCNLSLFRIIKAILFPLAKVIN